jgi:hypothetical protein
VSLPCINSLITFSDSRHEIDSANAPLPAVISHNTSCDQVIQLARSWIDQCTASHENCRIASTTPWYPTRLVDIEPVSTPEGSERIVQVVLTEDQEENKFKVEGSYVTLSHCWGNVGFIHLTPNTQSALQQGVSLDRLPRTFRDAIYFSRRLGIRYIWIDSLCILQGDEKESVEDWLHQSAQMDKVYNNSFCNISATAASDSRMGLFFERETQQSWIDEINLNTSDISDRINKSRIQKCTILDLSLWHRIVGDAPVNRRAWVLQERLMAPRVIHFCRDQIAWECCEMDAAECLPEGLPLLQLKAGVVVDGGRLKGIIPELDGRKLREARLKMAVGAVDPDAHLLPEMYAYEIWKHVVEVYSKTQLTQHTDKLIALSGIAKMMHGMIRDNYIAGMWEKYLASQLLWYVEPKRDKDRYLYPSTRQEHYRAPTFSWASVDAEKDGGGGITYGETTDRDLLIRVKEVNLVHITKDKFGLVEKGHLLLKGRLKKIEMKDSKKDKSTRYAWHLVKDGKAGARTYKHVKMDCPSSNPEIFVPGGQTYCLPAAWVERKGDSQHLICLLLKLVDNETGKFERIGWSKITPLVDGQKEILEPFGDEANMPCERWDADAGKGGEHTIRII